MKPETLALLGFAMLAAGVMVGIVRHEWSMLAFLVGGVTAVLVASQSEDPGASACATGDDEPRAGN